MSRRRREKELTAPPPNGPAIVKTVLESPWAAISASGLLAPIIRVVGMSVDQAHDKDERRLALTVVVSERALSRILPTLNQLVEDD